MSVVSITETKEGTYLRNTVDEYGNIVAETNRVFSAVCSETATTPRADRIDILNHASCPAAGSDHPDDSWLKCQKVDITHNSGCTYQVIAEYKSLGDPVLRLPVIEYDHQVTSEQIDKDINDQPLQVSSGEPLDPPLNEEKSDRVIRYTFYTYSYSSSTAAAFNEHVNDGTYAGFPAGTVKIGKFAGTMESIGGYVFYRVIVELVVREQTWKRRCLDQGFRQLTTGTPGFKAILDDEKNPVTEPVKLDGTGKVLAAEAPPYWHLFETKESANFNSLPINPLLIT